MKWYERQIYLSPLTYTLDQTIGHKPTRCSRDRAAVEFLRQNFLPSRDFRSMSG
jgi:hypothetical protein